MAKSISKMNSTTTIYVVKGLSVRDGFDSSYIIAAFIDEATAISEAARIKAEDGTETEIEPTELFGFIA